MNGLGFGYAPFVLLLLAACSGTPLPGADAQAAQAEPTVTPIPTAPAVARPLYVVQAVTGGVARPRPRLGQVAETTATSDSPGGSGTLPSR